jgi:hypothetical protein
MVVPAEINNPSPALNLLVFANTPANSIGMSCRRAWMLLINALRQPAVVTEVGGPRLATAMNPRLRLAFLLPQCHTFDR